MLDKYLKNIYAIASHDDAREESFYSALEKLVQEFADSTGKQKCNITTLPKKTEAGNPDFRIWDGKQHITGYIEAKAPTVENLDQIEDSEQLKRYLHTFPNLILTNFFEFRLYRDGVLVDKVLIGRPYIIRKLKTIPPVEKEPEFLKLLEQFFSFSLPRAYTAKSLAVELAKRTRFLKEQVVTEELKEESDKGTGFILGFYEAFQKYLISGLTKDDFADLYSQTVTYGLFASRSRSNGEFNRKLAFSNIPKTIGVLRDIFRFISLEELPAQMEWIVDDIANVLAVADVNQILHKYYHDGKGKDPIIHFYETFLTEYDPATREKRGVYYTPEPVVSYIVRSLDVILKKYFDCYNGFAEPKVRVLDPAAGTLTFLAEVSKLVVERCAKRYGESAKIMAIKEIVLQNLYAFELMMAPYAIGHLKISFLLEELEYKLKDDERFQLYLTNTLEMEELIQSNLPGMSSLSEESHLAGIVKKETPILVILGNPPYSGHSTNIGEWISKEIKEYYQVDGKPLGERNPKWLQDDYVKFIRFAQWKIDQAGEGVLGFITNHSYLDNPTFRGMRQSLMNSFDEIYLLDLHGNSLKKEKCPDGSKDENVFDIMQGVSIALFIKKYVKKEEVVPPPPQIKLQFEKPPKEKIKKHQCTIYHSDIWGLRENKYDWLMKNDVNSTDWHKLKPKSEFYLFVPRDESLLKEYDSFPKITDIFPVNGVGMTTARDEFVIDLNKKALLNRIRLFKHSKLNDDELHATFNINKKMGWSIRKAWNMLQEFSDSEIEQKIQPVLYRPFDVQWIFYDDSLVWRTVKRIMQHMMKENLGFITRRQMLSGHPCNYVFVSEHMISDGVIRSDNKGGESLFPLYIYPEEEKKKSEKGSMAKVMMLFEPETEYKTKKPNISPKLIEELTNIFKKTPSPEEIFYYIYAVMYSNTYRTKYAEFLKTDFPRIPFAKDYKLFKQMAELGNQLCDLHLLKLPELHTKDLPLTGKGNNEVEKVKYEEKNKQVFINSSQYFENISQKVWEYQIGGYQVCEKWLKDRKGRVLVLEDIIYYCKIITAIQKTIETQKSIDKIYPKIEK